MRWTVLRVAPLRERWVGYEVQRVLGLSWYVPTDIRRVTRRGRVSERRVPLMPGYCFVADVGPTQWRRVAETRHVLGWLMVDGAAAGVSDADIARIRALEREMRARQIDARRPVTWRAGDRARIAAGPFADLETLLCEVRGTRVRIAVPLGFAWVRASDLTEAR